MGQTIMKKNIFKVSNNYLDWTEDDIDRAWKYLVDMFNELLDNEGRCSEEEALILEAVCDYVSVNDPKLVYLYLRSPDTNALIEESIKMFNEFDLVI